MLEEGWYVCHMTFILQCDVHFVSINHGDLALLHFVVRHKVHVFTGDV